ncbi:MAG: GntR family transcriptional regulator [Hyphomicrobiaceae bacterium]
MLASKQPFRRALYLQVRDVLAERIANGALKPGPSIANENDLAHELGVSAGTVRKALELMEAQRLIYRRQGKGTFVNDLASVELAARFCSLRGADGAHLNGRVSSVEIGEAVASEEERRQLLLAAGDQVYRIHRVYVHNSRAFMVEDATVPAALFPHGAARPEMAASITTLAREHAVLLGKAEDRVSLGMPTEAGAKALGIVSGTSVMRRERVVFMLNGAPAEWGVAQCHLVGGYYRAEIS